MSIAEGYIENKILQYQTKETSFKLLVRVIQDTPQIMLLSPSLMPPRTREEESAAKEMTYFRHRTLSNGVELIWKPPPWRIALIVSENTMEAAKGEKQPMILPAVKPMNAQ